MHSHSKNKCFKYYSRAMALSPAYAELYTIKFNFIYICRQYIWTKKVTLSDCNNYSLFT